MPEFVKFALEMIHWVLGATNAAPLDAMYGYDFWRGLWEQILATNSTLPGICYNMVQDDVGHAYNVVTFALNAVWDGYIGGDAHHFDYDCWQ